jgi:hypothetical protein
MIRVPRVRRAVLGLLLMVAALGPAAASEELRLRLELQAGQRHRFAVTQTQQMQIALGALGTQQTTSRMRMEFTYVVRELAPDGTAKIDAVYDRIRLELGAAGNRLEFDSNDAPSPDGNDPLQAIRPLLVGHSIGVELSARGEVVRVEGFEQLWDELGDTLPDDPASRDVLEMVRQGFGEDSLRGVMQVGTVVFPEEPIRPGQRWSHRTELNNPVLGRMTIDSSYEAQGTEQRKQRPCLKFGLTTQTRFSGNNPMIEQFSRMFSDAGGEMQLNWEIADSEGRGTMWVDRRSGLTVESEQTQPIRLTLSFGATGGEPAEGPAVQMEIEQQVRLELLD